MLLLEGVRVAQLVESSDMAARRCKSVGGRHLCATILDHHDHVGEHGNDAGASAPGTSSMTAVIR
jgi:hypothetical protein